MVFALSSTAGTGALHCAASSGATWGRCAWHQRHLLSVEVAAAFGCQDAPLGSSPAPARLGLREPGTLRAAGEFMTPPSLRRVLTEGLREAGTETGLSEQPPARVDGHSLSFENTWPSWEVTVRLSCPRHSVHLSLCSGSPLICPALFQ